MRKPISKRTRFEVFKRDKFTCQYCGESAPKVILECDHIDPVKHNGGNEIINLITSCFDCNRGKGDKLLSDDTKIQVQRKQLEQLQERREQLEMMLQWHEELMGLDANMADKAKSHWQNLTNGIHIVDGNAMNKIRKWIKDFSFSEILESMNISASQYLKWNGKELLGADIAFAKIGGILSVRKRSKENPLYNEIRHIKNILNCYIPPDTEEVLERAMKDGITPAKLKAIAYDARGGYDFIESVELACKNHKKLQN